MRFLGPAVIFLLIVFVFGAVISSAASIQLAWAMFLSLAVCGVIALTIQLRQRGS